MNTVKVRISRFRTVSAEILPDLPPVGALFHGRRVDALEPAPPAVPQPDPSVYAWAVWRLRLAGKIRPVYVAVHESESDIF